MAEWENGLCETDCNNCMAAWCCTCFLFGRTADRLTTFPNPNTEEFSNVNASCFIFYIATALDLCCIPLWMQRREVRDKFGIHGNGCSDCMVSFCCTPCAVSQLNLELKKRAAKLQQQPLQEGKGYVAPPGMTYETQP